MLKLATVTIRFGSKFMPTILDFFRLGGTPASVVGGGEFPSSMANHAVLKINDEILHFKDKKKSE